MEGHKGWHYRGYLPHCDNPDRIQTITYRLVDSVPEKLLEWGRAQKECDLIGAGAVPEWLDAALDAGHGGCDLARPDAAAAVRETLLRGDGKSFRLLSWVVMPTHVHLLIKMRIGHPMGRLVKAWKAVSGREIASGAGGSVWHVDYFDRYIRDSAHFASAVAYIHNNPVKAGLAKTPEAWDFSSAAGFDFARTLERATTPW